MPTYTDPPAITAVSSSGIDRAPSVDCVVVGGGIHGTYLSQRLLEDTALDRDGLVIVDPNDRLLDSFRRKARACGMESLRSTYVNHLGTDPFALEDFAAGNDREDELQPTVDYPDRPGLELFLDHADHVIESNSLHSLHRQTAVTMIHDRPDEGLRVVTDDGVIDTRSCVLAIGHGGRYHLPEWGRSVGGVEHVWGRFDPATDTTETVIIGGGITAAQLAATRSEGESVTLLSRQPLEWEVTEADPQWLNWCHIERELHHHPPASKARFDVVQNARHRATVPPYLYDTLDTRRQSGSLQVRQGEVIRATQEDDHVRLILADDTRLRSDRVVCATGFASVFDHPFVERLADTLDLDRGYRGLPRLDDDTLAWRTVAGDQVPLYVSGALALGTVGPYAPNIAGARRSADRITEAMDPFCERSTEPITPTK